MKHRKWSNSLLILKIIFVSNSYVQNETTLNSRGGLIAHTHRNWILCGISSSFANP